MRRNKKINQYNSEGNPEGYWEYYYYFNGQLECKGNYVNGEMVKGIEYEKK